MAYKIVRMYLQDGKRSRTIMTGLSLEQAQAYCRDPETSWKTAKGKTAKATTRRNGPWFDAYEEQ